MTGSAIILFVLAAVLVWGGLIASTLHLFRHPDTTSYPAGGDDDERDEHTVIVHDT